MCEKNRKIFLFPKIELLCVGIAATDSRVLSFSVATFREKFDQNVLLTGLSAAQFARGLQGGRKISAIKSMESVGERVDAWLAGGTAFANEKSMAKSCAKPRYKLGSSLSRDGKAA